MAEAAKGVGDISKNITGVAVAARDTTVGANNSQKAAQELTQMASRLQTVVVGLRSDIGCGRAEPALRRRKTMPSAMVVDDSRAVRMIIARTLRELGYEVIEAGNGLQAWTRSQRGRAVDVVLADWNMPEMDGLRLLKAMRANAGIPRLPVIMVTTEAEIEQMVCRAGRRRHRIRNEAVHERNPAGQAATWRASIA